MIGTGAEIIRYLTEPEQAEKPDIRYEITPHKGKRSRDANNYFWLLVHQIAKILKLSDLEVHDEFLSHHRNYYYNDDGSFDWKVSDQTPNKYGFIRERVKNDYNYYIDSGMTVKLEKEDGRKCKDKNGKEIVGNVFWHIKGTHQMNTAEMSRIISEVVAEAENHGIPTITPREMEKMMKQWGIKHG